MISFDNKTGKITHNGSELYFIKFGQGPKTLLAFHGFGLTKEAFLPVQEKLGDEFTIYSFDLFFHGQSYWSHKDTPLAPTELATMIEAFLNHFEIQRFSIITYSLGGKFGVCIAAAFTTRIDQLILIASDGFVLSPWYRFATGFKATRTLLKFFVFKPNLYFKITKFLHRFHLIPHATIRFAELNMSTRSLRRKVYLSWVVFRKLKTDTPTLCKQLNAHKVHVEFYFGDKDLLIPTHKILQQSASLQHRQVKVFNCSHSKVLLEYAKA